MQVQSSIDAAAAELLAPGPEWRRDRAPERRVLTHLGSPDRVSRLETVDDFTPLLARGLRRAGRPVLESLFEAPRLSEEARAVFRTAAQCQGAGGPICHSGPRPAGPTVAASRGVRVA